MGRELLDASAAIEEDKPLLASVKPGDDRRGVLEAPYVVKSDIGWRRKVCRRPDYGALARACPRQPFE
jgi:hypothetical protein